jgi:hypothetical protein
LRRHRIITLCIAVILVIFSIVAGCTGKKSVIETPIAEPAPSLVETSITPADNPVLPVRGFHMSILPMPFEGQSFADAYKEASGLADAVPVWGRPTPFYGMAGEFSGEWGKTFVDEYTRGNGMLPLFNMSFIGGGMSLNSPSDIADATLQNPEWRNAYKQAALDIVRAARPLYFSIGNEVNRWYEHHGAESSNPDGFQHYVSLYNEIYDAVKEISPYTNVYCIFAREIVAENREADLGVLKMFNPARMDLLVFTTYPYAVSSINRVDDIRGSYYAEALEYMPGKPFGITEAGWAALEPFGGEQGQADFIDKLAGDLTVGQRINLQLLGWPWLSALDENDYVALVKRDGTPRPALNTWMDIFNSKSIN